MVMWNCDSGFEGKKRVIELDFSFIGIVDFC